MREYRCHKKVYAGKIVDIDPVECPEHVKVDEGDFRKWQHVGLTFLEKHSPQVGGYFVEYEDGYQSYSPAEAFESGYTLISDSSITGAEANL